MGEHYSLKPYTVAVSFDDREGQVGRWMLDISTAGTFLRVRLSARTFEDALAEADRRVGGKFDWEVGTNSWSNKSYASATIRRKTLKIGAGR